MRIISLNVGLPSAQLYEGREVITAGAKKPVPRAVLRLGYFEGDGQADLVNHGGLEKAVCVYMRVLSEGLVAAGDGFDLKRAHSEGITIAEVNSIIYEKSYDVALIKRLAELAEFSEVGRTLFAQRLQRLARG